MGVSRWVLQTEHGLQKKEKERESDVRLGQDQEGVKLDMRQTIAESCALDREGYVHYEHRRATAIRR